MMKHSLFAAPLLLLAACGNGTAGDPGEAPLAGARIGGPFTLTSSDGETVEWSDFDGKYRMVYFGYAYCPDVCPLDVQRMMKAYAAFTEAEPDKAQQLQPIFITIDPERDTPEVVGQFTHAFSDDLLGLTGTPEQVKQAADAFSVYYAKGAVREDGSYLMDHSRAAYLMGRKGEPIALLPVDEDAQSVVTELEKWVR
ncbi:SCO family protein [Altericroceibacterium spongiae]|uniref:SCO family protein n=2 Tax=Altericroceibacterium spongiae TaxID=2320269 RepID=A0A420EJS5_9SPHN|nr:SCO family protein [Altericroceibacterium spongiae]RKF20836.1 SCO family protein [Altericroceibacterium spongiae]